MKAILPLLAMMILTAFVLGSAVFPSTVYIEKEAPAQEKFLLLPKQSSSMIKVPAVDESGKGVVTEILVELKPGSGKTLSDIENTFSFIDTQNSIRTAKEVAQNLTGIDLSQYDLIYTISTDASIVEGPSAGAAITIATIAALEGRELNPEVMITGKIFPDSTIGKVGQVLEKAKAAKQNSAKLFLVPKTGIPYQEYEYQKEISCETISGSELCETHYVKKPMETVQGIEIIEVSTIKEALEYFTSAPSSQEVQKLL